MKSKIRKILEKYLTVCEDPTFYDIYYPEIDDLEKELQRLMTKAVNRAFKNAEKKLYAKVNKEGEHTE